jgi:tRNA U34 5-methylaminomethyl-2-thiouridine-forming methyltransferase MnmC
MQKEREQNSQKISELKYFLDKNILLLKNTWEDKRNVAIQYNFIDKKDTDTTSNNKIEMHSFWELIDEYQKHNNFSYRNNYDDIDTYKHFMNISS